MSFQTGRKLFAERVELKLIELMNSYSGVAKLANPALAAKLRVFYSDYLDVSDPRTLRALQDPKFKVEEELVPLFWTEFKDAVRMPQVKARLCFGLPTGVDQATSCVYDVYPNKWSAKVYASAIEGLLATPFRIDGEQRGIFDDIAFFDLPPWIIEESGSLDLTLVERFMSLGTTLSFYFPAPHHQRWYTFCKGHLLPPTIRCGKKLTMIFNKEISPDVTSIVFGVDSAHRVSGSTDAVDPKIN